MYNKGSIKLLDSRHVDDAVIAAFVKHGFRKSWDVEYSETSVRFPEIEGDIETSLHQVISELYSLGYPFEGEITFHGDYEGAYEVHSDGTIELFSDDKWVIHKVETEFLIEELSSRGYVATQKS